MKICLSSLLAIASLSISSDAFSLMAPSGSASVTIGYQSTTIQTLNRDQRQNRQTSCLRMSDFESDFASAMPEKPVLSLQEQMTESATTFMADLESRLGEGVSAPTELEELKAARDGRADPSELAAKIYILLIEQGMLYDQSPDDGTLTLTSFNIMENLEIPEVKQEFSYLYKYGMSLVAKGIVDVETIKEIVKGRLIERTGLSPEDFDEWLGF